MNLVDMVLTTEQRAGGWSVEHGERIITLRRDGRDVYSFSADAFGSREDLRRTMNTAILAWEMAHDQAEPELAAALDAETEMAQARAVVEAEAEYHAQVMRYEMQPAFGPDEPGVPTSPEMGDF